MEKRYYIYGSRPIKEELKEIQGGKIRTYYAFQWGTGEFKEDMSYFSKIFYDLSGDTEEVGKEEFDRVVQTLRDKLNK